MNGFRQRANREIPDLADAPVLIVALGDSVTRGSMAGWLDLEAVYHNRLRRLLQRRWPDTVFSVINAGVGGETAAGGLGRLERDVIGHQPDLVTVGYGLNDSAAGSEGTAGFAKTLTTIVRRVQEETPADVILLTPNFMNRGPTQVAEGYADLVPKFMARQNDGVLAAYAQAVRRVGRERVVAVADVYAAWERLAAAGANTDALLANGLNHPNADAHRIPAELIYACIDPDFTPTAVDDLARH